LAACYLHGLAKAHGFADGNKRTAWQVARLFLGLNRYPLAFDGAEAVLMVVQVAESFMSEADCAAWFRARIKG
jgi:death-on-curing protein